MEDLYNEVDNDASLSLNEVTKKVEELDFRADLREKELIYLKGVIELAKNYDWLFVDLKGNLVMPSMDAIKESIRASNGYRFLSDPTKFFNDLEKGEIELE